MTKNDAKTKRRTRTSRGKSARTRGRADRVTIKMRAFESTTRDARSRYRATIYHVSPLNARAPQPLVLLEFHRPRPRPRPAPAAGNLAFLSVFVATIDAFVPCTVSVVVASAVARAIASSSAAVAASTSTSTSTALSRVLRTSSPIVATRAGALVIVGVVRGGVPAVVARAAGLVATRVARARLVATKGCPRALPGVRVGVGGISVIPEAVPARLERVPRARAHPSPLRDERTGVVVRRASGPVDSSHRQSRRREGRSAVLRHLGDPLLARTSPKRARVDVARIRPISGDDDPSEKVMSRGSR